MAYEIFKNTFRISPFTKSILFEKKHKSQPLEILEDHEIRHKH
jgi:hypothetical protein